MNYFNLFFIGCIITTTLYIQTVTGTEHTPFDQEGIFVVSGSKNTILARKHSFIELDSIASFKKNIFYFNSKQNDTNTTNITNIYNDNNNIINNKIYNTSLFPHSIIYPQHIEIHNKENKSINNNNNNNNNTNMKYVHYELPSWNLPLVVVAIPTFNRKEFLYQSLEYVKWQQYPRDRIYVAILDDSPISLYEDGGIFMSIVESLKEVGIHVHYKHRILIDNKQENIGQKRNSLVRWIKHDISIIDERDYIIIHWDDDDWHAPHRIMKQVYPLINGQSKLSALDLRTIFILHENKLYYRWAPEGRNISQAMPIMSINGGTLAYWISIFDESNKIMFPNLGCGEDIMFVDRVVNARYRITVLDDSDISVIYMRHKGNTWGGLDPLSWILLKDELLPPKFIETIDFYKNMQYWNKPYWKGQIKDSEEIWICSKNIDEIKTLVVNEIRGI